MDFDYHRILTSNTELLDTEIVELCDFCLAVFVSCDLALPTSLAERLSSSCASRQLVQYALDMMTLEFDDNLPALKEKRMPKREYTK